MPAPRKRAARTSGDGNAAAPEDATPETNIADIDIGDLSHLDEASAKGYVGELGDEGTNPNRED